MRDAADMSERERERHRERESERAKEREGGSEAGSYFRLVDSCITQL